MKNKIVKAITRVIFPTVIIAYAAFGVETKINSIIHNDTVQAHDVQALTDTANSYINMDEVVNITVSEDGIQFYYEDGSGYWWER